MLRQHFEPMQNSANPPGKQEASAVSGPMRLVVPHSWGQTLKEECARLCCEWVPPGQEAEFFCLNRAHRASGGRGMASQVVGFAFKYWSAWAPLCPRNVPVNRQGHLAAPKNSCLAWASLGKAPR